MGRTRPPAGLGDNQVRLGQVRSVQVLCTIIHCTFCKSKKVRFVCINMFKNLENKISQIFYQNFAVLFFSFFAPPRNFAHAKNSSEQSSPKNRRFEIKGSVTSKKLPNVYKSCPKMFFLETFQIQSHLQKMPKNVGDLGKVISTHCSALWASRY